MVQTKPVIGRSLMASSKDYLEYVLELLREIRGITYKKMMGEYMLYKDDIFLVVFTIIDFL